MVRWENGKDESYMRIVVLDGYTENPGDLSWKGLEDLGDLTVYDRTGWWNALARQRRCIQIRRP